jgi:hypothetical protein
MLKICRNLKHNWKLIGDIIIIMEIKVLSLILIKFKIKEMIPKYIRKVVENKTICKKIITELPMVKKFSEIHKPVSNP